MVFTTQKENDSVIQLLKFSNINRDKNKLITNELNIDSPANDTPATEPQSANNHPLVNNSTSHTVIENDIELFPKLLTPIGKDRGNLICEVIKCGST